MKRSLNLLLATFVLLSSVVATGCWSAPWPHRGIKVDMNHISSSKEELVSEIKSFLSAHQFRAISPGGYDAVNNRNTSLEFLDYDNLYISIEVDRPGVILIFFNQNRRKFSSGANDIFSELEKMLRKKWPDGVWQIEDRGDGGA